MKERLWQLVRAGLTFGRWPQVVNWPQRAALNLLMGYPAPEIVRLVAEAAAHAANHQVREAARRKLNRPLIPAAVEAVCQVWAESREVELGRLLTNRGWIAAQPLSLRVLTSLLTGQTERLPADDQAVIEELLRLNRQEADLMLAGRANAALERVPTGQLAEILAASRDTEPALKRDLTKRQEFIEEFKNGLPILVALRAGRPELLAEAGEPVVNPLLTLDQWAGPALAEAARAALLQLKNSQAQERLCWLAIEPAGFERPREIVLQAGYYPREPRQRALFYFLTHQWEKYESLDFDQSLMRVVYETAEAGLRQRISFEARQSGRPELVTIMVGGRVGRQARSLSREEWGYVAETLISGRRWEEAWQLARSAPPVWSARLLRALFEANWFPANPSEQAVFADLALLSSECQTATPPLGRQLRAQTVIPQAHQGEITTMALSQDGQLLVTGGTDGRLRFWRMPEGHILDTVAVDFGYVVRSVALSPDGQTLAFVQAYDQGASRWNSFLKLLSLKNKEIIASLEQETTTHTRYDLAFNESGQCLYQLSDNKVNIWDVEKRNLNKKSPAFFSRFVNLTKLAIKPPGDKITVAGRNVIRQWVISDEKVEELRDNRMGLLNCIIYSSDSSLQVAGNNYGHILIWSDELTKQYHNLYGHHASTYSLAFSPDGTVLASGHQNAVRLWDMGSYKPLKTVKKHTGAVRGLAFGPQGDWLVSAGADGKIVIWSSRLAEVAYRPLEQSGIDDLLFARQSQRDPALPANERAWLRLVETLLAQQYQHEIEIEDEAAHQPAEYDIIIEG